MTDYEIQIETEDAQKVDRAWELIQRREWQSAEPLLKHVIKRAPSPGGYTTHFTRDNVLYYKSWDDAETEAVRAWHEECRGKNRSHPDRLIVIKSAYPRAFHYLGYGALESANFSTAVSWLEKGRLLDPESPKLLCELAMAFRQLNQHERALDLYNSVTRLSRPVSSHDKAVALRGAAYELIEFGRLSEAREKLRLSLALEPGNSLALNELRYIDQLQGK